MKQTLKRMLAVTLSLLMMTSMLIVGNAENDTVTISEDFTGAELTEAGVLTTQSGWTGKREVAANAVQTTLTDGAFTWTAKEGGFNYRLYAPEAAISDTYTWTASLKVSEQGERGYSQISFGLNSADVVANRIQIMVNSANGDVGGGKGLIHLQAFVSGASVGSYTMTDAQKAAFIGNTVTVTFVRAGEEASMTVTAADGTELGTLSATFAGLSATAPGIRLQSGGITGTDHDEDGTPDGFPIYTLDNLVIEKVIPPTPVENILPDTWQATTLELTDLTPKVSGEFTAENGWAGKQEQQAMLAEIAVADGKLAHTGQTGDGKNSAYLIVSPEAFVQDTYSFTGELKLAFNSNDYYRIFIRPFKNAKDCALIHVSDKNLQVGFFNAAGNGWAENQTVSGPANYMDKDLQFKLVRDGANMSFSLWVKGDEANTAIKFTHTAADANNTATNPDIRVQTGKNTTAAPTIYLSNLRLDTLLGEIGVVGAQASVETANDAADTTFAVRFVSAIDSAAYGSAGYRIVAKDAENNTLKEWTINTTKAYDAILGETLHGTEAYTAEELGGNKLTAVTVYNIPKSLGTVNFEVQCFCVAPDGVTEYYSNIGTCAATVGADGTVTLA